MAGTPRPLLEVRGLEVEARTRDRKYPILRGVDLSLWRGEILGLIGESGSGKSVTGRSLMGLLAAGLEARTDLRRFDDQDVTSARQQAALLGRRIGFVPQNPRASLNPVFTVGDQLVDVLRRLRGLSRSDARRAAVELLRQVQIPDPERRLDAFPHQLSGGMCQRICIAIALSGRPDLIIADEPTTGLDVTTQAEILVLLQELILENGSAGLLITHDVGVVAEVCHRVAVMYAGRIVEEGPTDQIFKCPMHPYTARLIGIATSLDLGEEPETIPGQVPRPYELGRGCAFAPRCFQAEAMCSDLDPAGVERAGHRAYCHFPLAPAGAGAVSK